MRYKTPRHVRQYVKSELYEYKTNKRKLQEMSGSTNTRAIIIATQRIEQIETVLDSLTAEDRQAAELIFFEKFSQAKAELYGIGKGAYYNAMNKIIYLTAKEMGLL